jgi:hypothetical protein
MTVIDRIIRGCGHLPGYGSHPGTGYIVAFSIAVFASGVFGALDAGTNWIAGGFIGLAIGSPLVGCYLYGAYSRATSFDRRKKAGGQ